MVTHAHVSFFYHLTSLPSHFSTRQLTYVENMHLQANHKPDT